MGTCQICGAKDIWVGIMSSEENDRRLACFGCATGVYPPGTDLLDVIKKITGDMKREKNTVQRFS